MTGVLVLVGTLAVVSVFGLAWRARQGRVRPSTGRSDVDPKLVPEQVRELVDPASRITLVQLSTTFCAPCGQTRVLLGDLAEHTDGLRHVDLDLTGRPELAAELHVTSTPTTLAVDSHGVELIRVRGVPRRDTLLAALRPHLAA